METNRPAPCSCCYVPPAKDPSTMTDLDVAMDKYSKSPAYLARPGAHLARLSADPSCLICDGSGLVPVPDGPVTS
jgi:hypothetical protein